MRQATQQRITIETTVVAPALALHEYLQLELIGSPGDRVYRQPLYNIWTFLQT
jgi:hypothetical protein